MELILTHIYCVFDSLSRNLWCNHIQQNRRVHNAIVQIIHEFKERDSKILYNISIIVSEKGISQTNPRCDHSTKTMLQFLTSSHILCDTATMHEKNTSKQVLPKNNKQF